MVISFSFYSSAIYLTISATLILKLMKLLVTLNVVKLVTLNVVKLNGFNWIPSLNLTFTVLWTSVDKDLLIRKTQLVSFDFQITM